MDKGVFYGVSVGPGDPMHMTLGAVETIKRCPVIAAPRTKDGRMVALEIAEKAAKLSDKTILPLYFSMSHDSNVRREHHSRAVEQVRGYLDSGTDIAMLNLGDVSIYASYQYLAESLEKLGYETVMIPGVTSFCASAAALNISLTEIGRQVHIIPGGKLDEDVEKLSGTKIWMKSGAALRELIGRFKEEDRLEGISMVQNCGMDSQRVYKSLRDADIQNDYFSLVIEKE